MSESRDITHQVHDVQVRVVDSLKAFVFSRSASVARAVSEDVGEAFGDVWSGSPPSEDACGSGAELIECDTACGVEQVF